MSSVYWGSRQINAVASNGVATVLFPVGAPASAMVNTATYPPATSGKVRRTVQGRIGRIEVTADGSNGGRVELWDVAGLDRGASNNTNNGDTVTNAFLAANGVLIGKINISSTATFPFTATFDAIPFNNGLAVRYIDGGAGYIDVAPYIEGGFMVQEVHS